MKKIQFTFNIRALKRGKTINKKTKVVQDKESSKYRILISISFALKGPVKEFDLSNVLTSVSMEFDCMEFENQRQVWKHKQITILREAILNPC